MRNPLKSAHYDVIQITLWNPRFKKNQIFVNVDHECWSGSWKSHDPDQISHRNFLIRIKNSGNFFWSGSKFRWNFFDPDQKIYQKFLIRIKKSTKNFWSRSKNRWKIFDPGSKIDEKFLIWIKKSTKNFWSESKNR